MFSRRYDWKLLIVDVMTVGELTVDELTVDDLTLDELTWYRNYIC